MSKKSKDRPTIQGPARRHVLALMAAGAARVSAIAAGSALLTNCNLDDDPNHSHNCFVRGTNILTDHGEVPVETLTVADNVLTTKGPVAIKAIQRQVVKRGISGKWHPCALPVCVRRFAIDGFLPHKDLYLSQEHALYLDGVLIPAKYLVNGVSVILSDPDETETIEYYRMELQTHEVVFAEGAAAESFISTAQPTDKDLDAHSNDNRDARAPMMQRAPILRYKGGREELRGLVRLVASRFVDIRDPIQKAHDRIAARVWSSAA
jgi:hypothetical protein